MTVPKAWIAAAIVGAVGLLILRGLTQAPRSADPLPMTGMAMPGSGMGNPSASGTNQQGARDQNGGTAK